jgi:hypothetical protein
MFCLPIIVCPRYFGNIIQWQLNSLQKSDNIGFGKRATVLHSVLDGQVCGIGRDERSKNGVGVKVHPKARALVKDRVLADAPHDAEQVKCDNRYVIIETVGCLNPPIHLCYTVFYA